MTMRTLYTGAVLGLVGLPAFGSISGDEAKEKPAQKLEKVVTEEAEKEKGEFKGIDYTNLRDNKDFQKLAYKHLNGKKLSEGEKYILGKIEEGFREHKKKELIAIYEKQWRTDNPDKDISEMLPPGGAIFLEIRNQYDAQKITAEALWDAAEMERRKEAIEAEGY